VVGWPAPVAVSVSSVWTAQEGVADFIWLYVDAEVFRFRTEGSFESIAEVNGTLNCIFLKLCSDWV
jgi:hypothetical protein